jgi:N-acetyl-gamma-glutamyl-phosphate reductase
LLRLLARHPEVELTAITSRGEAGGRSPTCSPACVGAVGLKFSDPKEAPLGDCDVVFFATPNGIAMQQAADLLAAGVG